MSVDPKNADIVPRGDYGEILRKIAKEGHCPFCPEYFLKHHTNPILAEGEHWLVTTNFRPYEGTSHHFLLISKHHVERISLLPKGAGDELVDHHRWLEAEFGFAGSSLFWREGDTALTGASVCHLHCNIIVGVSRTDDARPISVLLGFKP